MPRKLYSDFSAGMVDTGTPEMVPANGLWNGQNITLGTRGSVASRPGTSQQGDTISGSRQILGLHGYFKHTTDTVYPLMAFNTDIYRLVTSTWTAQSLSLTADKEGNFLDAFDNVYYNNGTDDTQIWNGSSWSTDANFKKGKIMAFFENRIIVAVGNLLWFTTLGTTTFVSTQYVNAQDVITGLLVGDFYLYIFMANDMYRIQRFEQYDGQIFGPDAFEKMPCHIGTISHRSLAKIGRDIYTLTHKGVYRIEQEGLTSTRITEDCETSFASLDKSEYAGASGVAFGDKYYLAVRGSGQTYNNLVFVFDTTNLHQSVFGTDAQPTFLPAFYFYKYVDAELYPEVLAVIPESAGEERLYFGDGNTGRVFRMETGTNDNSSAITSIAEKPVLTDVGPDSLKRFQKLHISNDIVGQYNLQWAVRPDEYDGFSDTALDLTSPVTLWGGFIWGVHVIGSPASKKSLLDVQQRGYFFVIRLKSDQADEPWRVSLLGVKYRVNRRYLPKGRG